MRFRYETNFKLFKLAIRTYIRSSATRRFWFHFQMWGMLTLGLLILLASRMLSDRHQYLGLLSPIVGGLVGGGAVCPLLRPWNMRRTYNAWTGEAKGKMLYIEVAGNELHSGIEGQSEARFQRSAICGTAQDDVVLLLFLNKKKFIYLPKYALPPEALVAVESWLELPGPSSPC